MVFTEDALKRKGRILFVVLALMQWALLMATGAIILGWLVGRILTDRFGWSQWLWWIPTPVVLEI